MCRVGVGSLRDENGCVSDEWASGGGTGGGGGRGLAVSRSSRDPPGRTHVGGDRPSPHVPSIASSNTCRPVHHPLPSYLSSPLPHPYPYAVPMTRDLPPPIMKSPFVSQGCDSNQSSVEACLPPKGLRSPAPSVVSAGPVQLRGTCNVHSCTVSKGKGGVSPFCLPPPRRSIHQTGGRGRVGINSTLRFT